MQNMSKIKMDLRGWTIKAHDDNVVPYSALHSAQMLHTMYKKHGCKLQVSTTLQARQAKLIVPDEDWSSC